MGLRCTKPKLSEEDRLELTVAFSILRKKHALLVSVIKDVNNKFKTNDNTEVLFDTKTTKTIDLLDAFVETQMDETFGKALGRVESLMLRDENIEASVGWFGKTTNGALSVMKTFNILVCSALLIVMGLLYYLFSLKPEVFLVLVFSSAAAAVIGWMKMTW